MVGLLVAHVDGASVGLGSEAARRLPAAARTEGAADSLLFLVWTIAIAATLTLRPSVDGAGRFPWRHAPRLLPAGRHRTCRVVCARRGQAEVKITPAGLASLKVNEQVTFPPLPCDRYPSSGHPLPDLPPHRRVPARHPQRGPD